MWFVNFVTAVSSFNWNSFERFQDVCSKSHDLLRQQKGPTMLVGSTLMSPDGLMEQNTMCFLVTRLHSEAHLKACHLGRFVKTSRTAEARDSRLGKTTLPEIMLEVDGIAPWMSPSGSNDQKICMLMLRMDFIVTQSCSD